MIRTFLFLCVCVPCLFSKPIDEPKTSLYNSLLHYAAGFLGHPYGHQSPAQIDCSRFTQEVYKHIGIRIPRNVIAQAQIGKKIDFHEIREGDLLFFYRTNKSFPSHVGIYAGDRKIIHASYKAQRVHFDNIDKPFFQNRFLFAKRLIADERIDNALVSEPNIPQLSVIKTVKMEPDIKLSPKIFQKMFRNYQLFEGREVILSTEGKNHLRKWASMFLSQKNRSLTINVHTDSIAPEVLKERFATNLALSQARADVIAGYLSTLGIDPSSITARGMGDSFPIASDDTPEGQSRNRRVELEF